MSADERFKIGVRIECAGRMGALISLGAGFNPVLTGRENIYVNGSVQTLKPQAFCAGISRLTGQAQSVMLPV